MAKASSKVTVEVGQRVNYVMADGQIRPMDVVIANGNIASGYVLFANGDLENLPEGITANAVTVSFSPHQTVPIPSFVENVVYDDTRIPGTYHFDEEDAGEGFEKAVLQEQIDDLRKQIKALMPKKDKTEKPAKLTGMPTPA